MPKWVKLTPTSIEQIDDWKTDPDYINTEISGYALNAPSLWSNKYLTFFCLDVFKDEDVFNPLATNFEQLKKSIQYAYRYNQMNYDFM